MQTLIKGTQSIPAFETQRIKLNEGSVTPSRSSKQRTNFSRRKFKRDTAV